MTRSQVPIGPARPSPGAARPSPAPARPSPGAAGGPEPHHTETARFCRVTVLAPRTRMDLALPTDLTVAELVPMLCELTGEMGPRSHASGTGRPRPSAWCLAAVAGAEMPPGGTLAALGVLDGDLLRLRRRAEAPPPPVFDDPVDAVAEAVPAADGTPGPWGYADNNRGGEPLAVRPWDEWFRRRAGLTAAVLVTALAAVTLAATRGPGTHAVPNQFPFELRNGGEDAEHQTPVRC